MIDTGQYYSMGGISVIVMIVMQAAKGSFFKDPRWNDYIPWIAAGLGVAFAFLLGWARGALVNPDAFVGTLIGGMLAGFAGVGIYEGTLDKRTGSNTVPDQP